MLLLFGSVLNYEFIFLSILGPMSKRYAKYAFSQDEYKEVDENSPLYAVDCEMCLTNVGKLELTKVCVVDSDLNEIYQSLVKPRNRIVNYLTRFSGITETILENVETRLEDVQQALKKLLPSGTFSMFD
jgi:RNA exonuclease 1